MTKNMKHFNVSRKRKILKGCCQVLFSVLFLLLTLPAFAHYTASPPSTTNGGGTWGSILWMGITVDAQDGNKVTFTLKKQSGAFKNTNEIFLKAGDYGPNGEIIDQGTAESGDEEWTITLTAPFNESKTLYFYSVNYEGDAWVGPIQLNYSNTAPDNPVAIQEPKSGDAGQSLTYTYKISDPDGDRVKIHISWGDGTGTWKSDKVSSGSQVSTSHSYNTAGTYNLYATVFDEHGVGSEVRHASINITGTGGNAPTVTLNSPNSGAFKVGDQIPIDWTSNNQHHFGLYLLKGGTKVGTIFHTDSSTAQSYLWTVDSPIEGHKINGSNYKIKVAVWNSAGVSTGDESDGTITFNEQQIGTATIDIISPTNGQFVSGTDFKIKASVKSEIGIKKIELYINNLLIDTVKLDKAITYNYEYSWNTAVYDDGINTIKIVAYDKRIKTTENQVTVIVDNPQGISGRLRVVDQSDPTNPDKIWNIDNIDSDLYLHHPSYVTIGEIKMKVKQDGTFDSGSESLPDGKYNVTCELNYYDYMKIIKYDYDGTPIYEIRTRTSKFNKSVELKQGKINIDYPLPIFLIHGFFSDGYMWGDWRNLLLEKGFIVFTPTHKYLALKPAKAKEIVERFCDDMDGMNRDGLFTNIPEVFFVCHSEGGVSTRTAIYFGKKLKNKIKCIYTLGTPHSGTDLSLAPGGGLSVDQMIEYNKNYPNFKGISIYAISGHGDYFNKINDCNINHDGVVYWDPDLSLEDPRENVSPFHIITDRENFIISEAFEGYSPIYDSNGHHFCFHHGDLIDKGINTILEETILPHMKNKIAKVAGVAADHSFRSTGRSSYYNLKIFEKIIILNPHEIDNFKFFVSSTDSVKFNAGSIKNDFELSIIDPDGTEVTPNNYTSYGSARYASTRMGFQYTISNPKPGQWTLKVINGNDDDTVALGVRENATWGITGTTNKLDYKPSADAVFTAKITGDDSGVSISSLRATISNDYQEDIDSMTLYDDGAHHDGKAGDKVYGNIYKVPSPKGHYNLKYHAEAQYLGTTAQREYTWGFNVLSSKSVFTGTFTDQAFDSDSDGLNDQIIAGISLYLTEPGEYVVSGDLEDGAGYPIDHAVTTFDVEPGNKTVELKFDLGKVGCTQFNSPFKIKDLRISTGNLTPLDIWEEEIFTGTYLGSDFGCVPNSSPGPAIIGVIPSSGSLGESKKVTISGNGFQEGAAISFGNGISITNITRLSSSAFTMELSIDPGASPGTRDVTVTNPDGGQNILPDGFMVFSNNSGLSLSRHELVFGAVPGRGATGSQNVFINTDGGEAVQWSAVPSYNWIKVSPSSGKGKGAVTVSIDASVLGIGIYTGSIVISSPNAINSPRSVQITLEVRNSGSKPFGVFANPRDVSKVYGVVPVSGWTLDDIEVAKVQIYRGNKNARVYIGEAMFVEGTRPDVEQTYPDYPMNYRCGWGYMLLTNILSNNGNGTFKLYAIATDIEGNQVELGSRTIICDNANAVKPFGTIDTPGMGEIASGRKYENTGWVLTPMPNQIPGDGSTIEVFLDGLKLGNTKYSIFRSDIADLFPGYANSSGAGGSFQLDTTPYRNGVHTIEWVAADDAGNKDGIGSRYFTILNTGNSNAAQVSSCREYHRLLDINAIPLDYQTPPVVFKGYGHDQEPQKIVSDKNRRFQLKISELERVEIHLNPLHTGIQNEVSGFGDHYYVGYQVVGDQLRPLPVGSTMDIQRGIFYWQPGVGFSGLYRFVFIERGGNEEMTKKYLNIKISPKFPVTGK